MVTSEIRLWQSSRDDSINVDINRFFLDFFWRYLVVDQKTKGNNERAKNSAKAPLTYPSMALYGAKR